MDQSNCHPSQIGQAGQSGKSGSGKTASDDRKPTGQAGTGQSDDPGTPGDYDDDPQGGGGKLDQVKADDAPNADADAASHGSR